MCGINGAYSYHYAANPIDVRELARSRDHMAARGPDARGQWLSPDGRVGLGHRRLSIIDLTETGAQPMASDDGRFVITFNGEIYNFQALRDQLVARGHHFRGRSDTEVLLRLYAANGPAMMLDLRGMFAFAIWDAAERTLFLARDPHGIKPLYYADDGWGFRFASQVKALIAGGGVSRDPDPAGEVGFYLFGHVPEPFTTHRAIRALPAGSTLRVDRLGAGAPQRYHSIARVYCDAKRKRGGKADAFEAAREALLDSVRHHLIADVPIGAFLSSGIDSSSLVGLIRDAGRTDVQTLTLTFAEFSGTPQDEAPLAAEVARDYGVAHTVRHISHAEFERDLPKIFEAMDQPSIDGVNTWFVSKAAHELGLKVAISGLGGDELFGGYPSFHDIPRWLRLFGQFAKIPLAGALTRTMSRPLVRAFRVNPKAAGMLEYGGTFARAYLLKRALFMPWELTGLLAPDVVAEGLRRLMPVHLLERELRPNPPTAAGRISVLESTQYMRSRLLRDTDWASMAHSLEVRTPLVDATLLQSMVDIFAACGEPPSKAMLARAPTTPLPARVRQRPKTGFMTPIATWQRQSARHRELASSPREPWARAWAGVVRNGPEASWRPA